MSDSGRSSLIGVAISLVGNILISLALNCQKLAHIRLEREGENGKPGQSDDEESQRLLDGGRGEEGEGDGLGRGYGSGVTADSQRTRKTNSMSSHGADGENDGVAQQMQQSESLSTTFLRSKLWWLGICLMSLGEFGNFLSYGFAPASLVAPLGAVALLANVIFSPILLNEHFYPSDIGGILLAIIGAVTVVFSSKQSDVTLNPGELWDAICRTVFIIYAVIAIALAGFLAWCSTTSLGQRWILLDVGVCAVLGGFTVLSTKGLSSLLSQGNIFDLLRFPITYGLIVVLAGTALAQITFLNRALQRFDSREVIPTQFVMFTISAIVGSAILYRDFDNMDAHRLINFLFGCLTTFAGVFTLTRHNDGEGAGEEEALDEGEAAGEGAEHVDEAGEEGAVVPVASAPKRARPLSVVVKAGRASRALTTGSVPTLSSNNNGQGQSLAPPGLVALTPASASLTSTSGSAPKYIVTRRSIFNPTFPVAFVESSSHRRMER